ncbi:MAG: serine hydrolase domain-containing protein [Actinomycetota bacterium]
MTGLEEALERIGQVVEHHLPLTHAAGLALAVTDDHDTLGAVVRGFADVAGGRGVRPETRFQIGSISKSWASLCLLQEEAKSTLALDVSINEILPWLELPEPFGPITLHHLLTHTSGLMIGVEHAPWSRIDALLARDVPATMAPGERFWYSNLAYKLVGFALEDATGMPINDVLTERLIGPLALTDTFAAITQDLRADAAVGYDPLFDDRPAHLNHPLAPAPWQPSNTADGSIVSTAPDLAAYARIVLNGGRASAGELLDPDRFSRWVGPHVATGDEAWRYGYGWDVSTMGRRVLRHTGGTVGFTGLLEIWPEEGIAVAITMNGGGSKHAIATYALMAVSAALRGEPLPPVEYPLAPDHIAGAEELAGSYAGGERSWELESQDDGLVLRAGPLAVRLERWEEPDVFAVPHPAFDRHLLRVVRDVGGAVVGLTHGPAALRRDGVSERPAEPRWAGHVGLFRSNDPWGAVVRIYERGGRLYATWPSDGEEFELTRLDDVWFAVGEPRTPRRARFGDIIDGVAHSFDLNGGIAHRSFEG